MTAEPIRQPDDETEDLPRPEDQGSDTPSAASPEPDGPSADESLIGSATEPVMAPGESLTAESLTPEAAESAEAEAAAEADPNMDPNASEAAVAAADAQEAPTTAEAVATIDAASDAPAATPAADAAARTTGGRRAAVGRALRQLAIVVIGLTLLVAGVALGNYAFQTSRPAPTGGAADPNGPLTNPPAAAQEFISALSINDADAIRSSLDRDPHLDLTREMTKYGIQRVDQVEVLGTTVDGPRSATEILMHYERDDGISFAINLVILVDDGKIEGFR